MILVDTTVVSEPLCRAPEPRVAEWLVAQLLEMLYLSAIAVAELRFGVWSLPAGRRRDRLHGDLEERVPPMFAGRVLPFDPAAWQACAELMAKPRSGGRSIAVSDGCIAATAGANGMMVATRDTARFEAAGLKAVDPWTVQETTAVCMVPHRRIRLSIPRAPHGPTCDLLATQGPDSMRKYPTGNVRLG